MRFSLIEVYKECDSYIDGVWIQDVTCDLSEAVKLVRDTEKANSKRIKVAVFKCVGGSCLNYFLRTKIQRLDKKGNNIL